MSAGKKRRRLVLVLLPLLIVLSFMLATGRGRMSSAGDAASPSTAAESPQAGIAGVLSTAPAVSSPSVAEATRTDASAPEGAEAAVVETSAHEAPAPEGAEAAAAETSAPEASTSTTAGPEASGSEAPLPDGFVHVSTLIPDLVVELRYLGDNNFTGRPVVGYEKNTAILTLPAAQALAKVQAALATEGLGLIVYDAYRPTQAVADFVRWGGDLDDQTMKDAFYPDIPKADILGKGFVATRSSHSRGSTVDVSLVSVVTGEVLDMGTPFDWFGPESDPDYAKLSAEQAQNRTLLRMHMEKGGFLISSIEWWHFRLKNEPFPKTYFDFPVR